MPYYIFFLFFFWGCNSYSQLQPSYVKNLDESNYKERQEYYLVNPTDSLYKVKIYRNDTLHMETYSSILDVGFPYEVGYSRRYYSSGNIMDECFHNDKHLMHGRYTGFYENGLIRVEIDFYNHMYKGIYRKYFSTGKIEINGYYDYHESDSLINTWWSSKVGIWEYYFPDGKKKCLESYWSGLPIPKKYTVTNEEVLSGKLTAEDIEKIPLLPNGEVDFGKYERSVKHGEWKYWNKKGKLVKIERYNKDKLVETKAF